MKNSWSLNLSKKKYNIFPEKMPIRRSSYLNGDLIEAWCFIILKNRLPLIFLFWASEPKNINLQNTAFYADLLY